MCYTDHHSAAYYPHAHQTLHCSSSERRRRRKKKEKSIYKSNKASRPSRLFQPSLDEVSEQVCALLYFRVTTGKVTKF